MYTIIHYLMSSSAELWDSDFLIGDFFEVDGLS